MERYARIWLAGIALACVSGLRAGETVGSSDAPLRIALTAQDAPSLFSAQLLGDMDRPVGDGIKMQGLRIPARLDAKGQLELDVKGDGKFKAIAKQDVLSVALKGDGEKPKNLNIKLLVFKRDDGVWCYRNMTMLLAGIGTEQFVVVDANGNGAYNEPGVDGLAWAGQTWLFPLPDKSERWCSATQEFTGLQLGAWGENPAALGKPLATTVPEALPVLKGVNDERVKLGLTPRPEDTKLSADLQKHCSYMNQNNVLAHGEDKGKSGYTPEGNAAGMRSIISAGTSSANVAAMMVQTYFHRQDVVRPNTLAFGVGYLGRYGGIDGRTNCSKAPAHFWPVICPVPGQAGLPAHYQKEMPDATPGDDAAGYPITAYFGTGKLKLTSHSLKAIGPAAGGRDTPVPLPVAGLRVPPTAGAGEAAECYTYDPHTGANSSFSGFQQAVCIIAKDPLKPNTEYEVTLTVDVEGRPWTKTWRFSTGGGGGGHGPRTKPKR